MYDEKLQYQTGKHLFKEKRLDNAESTLLNKK